MATHLLPDSHLVDAARRGDFQDRFIAADPAGPGYRRLDGAPGWSPALREPRGPLSAKAFCLPARELVARYAPDAEPGLPEPPRRLVVGVRACELRALRYLDAVFSAPPAPDPLYRAHRDAAVLVSVDCIRPHASCFCNLLDGRPYADSGFDLNLTPIGAGYVVEEGSAAGQALLAAMAGLLVPATADQLAERDRVRAAAVAQLEEQNAARRPARPPSEVLAGREDDERWEQICAGCVECGACTQICPTCHCFYLRDGGDGQTFERQRAWDSCVWSGYSRMAGAAGQKPNPRARFRSRLANRFLHKFVWSLTQWQMLGCVGCGRCTDACPGKIDVRAVLKEAVA